VVNQHLYRDLKELGLWTPELVDQIIEGDGSIQHIQRIPVDLRNRYKTVWEISQKILIDYSAARGAFIDQTQSMNIFQSTPDFSKLASSHFYGWKNGLKTGMYYLRTQPAVDPIKFGLDPMVVKTLKEKYSQTTVCPVNFGGKIPEGCEVCSA
jgi:ribonucleotide reductase alpha subunit